MLFMDLHNLGKQVHASWIVAFIGGTRRIFQILDNEQEIGVGLFHHFPSGLVPASGVDIGGFLHLLQLDVLYILTDHADTLRHIVDRLDDIFRELVEHPMQFAK